jgi:DNA-binding NarL/FixJ family response regulator
MIPTDSHRILIVDDHKIVRQGLRILLESYPDFRVVGEADGTTAVAKAVDLQPNIVLMDLQLPQSESGFAILSQVRQSLPEARVVILTSSDAQPSLVYRAIREGAVGYVMKDTSDIHAVAEAIQKVALGQVYFSGSALMNFIGTITSGNEPFIPGNQIEADRLSPRECAVLDLVAQGHTNREIADRLIISESTVRSHLHNILDKLQLDNRVQAATYALRTRPATQQHHQVLGRDNGIAC